MYFGSVNRMIFVDLVKVFLMSLVGLTGMFLLAGLIQEATQKGLSPAQIITAIPLIIPTSLPFTIPATTLFATCIVYGRMSADNEVLVLRAAGVNIYHLLWPALLLGILTTATTAALFYDIIPRSQVMLRASLLKDGENLVYAKIKRDGGLRQNNLDFVLFVRDVQGKDLIDVVVKKRRPDRNGYELVARAQRAKIRIREVESLYEQPEELTTPSGEPRIPNAVERFQQRRASLRKVGKYELVVFMDRCHVDSLRGGTAADLQRQEYTTPLPDSIFGKDPKDRPSAQTWQELFQSKADVLREMEELEREIQQFEANPDAPAGPGRTNKDVAREYRAHTVKFYKRYLRQIETEMQMRPALALGCLCFVLIGCPVGIWASRSDYLSIFISCFLPTIFVYYPLLLASLNLSKDMKVPPISAWVADITAAVASVVLIRRLMKR